MKILFISREKQQGQISPVIQAQADSITELVELSIYSIKGRGWRSYFNGISALRKHLRSNDIDLIHAHYSYIGMVAGLATCKPIVVSLMGSDVEDYRFGRLLIRLFSRFSWKKIIVKSGRLKEKIRLNEAIVIPNGLNPDLFRAINYEKARSKLSFDPGKKYILFLADPARPEKNFKLAAESCEMLADNCELLAVHEQAHSEIPLYLSAADVLLLTSHFEGSPNAIKEAMACNCPIVSTDVGDVKEVMGDTGGCYITSFDPEDVAAKLKLALDLGKRTNGREKIQHLDDRIIAKRLVEVYNSVLS